MKLAGGQPETDSHEDRRSSPRIAAQHRAKVFHRRTHRYLPAETCNVSDGGMLIRVKSPRELRIGEALDLAVDWAGEAVVRKAELTPATVVRIEPATEPGYSHAVAVFVPAGTGAALATGRAA
ncbi:MAG: PilZ domain-containing protein [Planctomycetota bacterium]